MIYYLISGLSIDSMRLQPIPYRHHVVLKSSIRDKLLFKEGRTDGKTPGTGVSNFGDTIISVDTSCGNHRYAGGLNDFLQQLWRIPRVSVGQQIHAVNAFGFHITGVLNDLLKLAAT